VPTAPSSATVPPAPKKAPPLPQLVTELRDLAVRYFREQTIVPLQQLGRYIGFGILGSLLLGFGVVFLGLSGLRALQEETGDTFRATVIAADGHQAFEFFDKDSLRLLKK